MPVLSEGLEGLEDRLLRGGIAPRHVHRYLRELSEHLADLTLAQREAGYSGEDATSRARAALGPDAELADAMLRQRDFRSISARFPWAVFLLMPPLAGMLMFLIPTLLLVIVAKNHSLLTLTATPPPEWFQDFSITVADVSNVLLVPLVAAMFTAIAWRQRIKPMWPLLATVVTLLFVRMHMFFPGGNHRGSFAVGILAPVFRHAAWETISTQWIWILAQWVLGLLPMLWLVARSHRRNVA